MSEVAIILSDLYRTESGLAVPKDVLPGLTRMARFAGVSALPGTWRGWLAGWLGRADLAAVCDATPAVVAAAAPGVDDEAWPADARSVWLATPLHLVAGLRSVHLDYRGLLHLDATTLDALCVDFNVQFAPRGFSLRHVAGRLLAAGPHFAQLPFTCDPARLMGDDIADSTPHGAGAAPLMSLGAELEMWLHEHALNLARARRRAAPLTTLWLWGGGERAAGQRLGPPRAHADATFMTVCGEDLVTAGLCTLTGARARPAAASAHAILNSGAARTAAVIELFHAGDPTPATLMDLLQHLDAQVLAPLVTALKDGVIRRLTLIANDRASVLTARDGLRFWRRSRSPWAVLQ